VVEAVCFSPFFAALARGSGFVVICSNALTEQIMQQMIKMLMAITRAHINPLMALPVWET
jgi:hypothetical protein